MSRARAALIAAGAVRAARVGLDVVSDDRWTRTNHRGEPVSLLAGPTAVVGLAAGSLAGGGRAGAAGALAALGAGAFGLVDDLAERPERARKGLRGHLGALREGEVTTGALKVVGIAATGVAASTVLGGGPGSTRRGVVGRGVDVVGSGALIAATANLVNLLDLRPGRALKAGAVLVAPVLATRRGGGLAAAVLGASAALAPPDLSERDMLGDAGANALGAVLGTAVVAAAPRPVRLAWLAGVVGLTVASERVSFSAVIERNASLRRIDDWGRR